MSARYDLLVVGEGGGHTLPKAGIKAVLGWLAASGYATPVAEAVATTWVAIYSEPGTAAHTAFAPGAAPPEASFEELCLWTGPRRPLPWGEGEASFYLEFRGCLYDHLPGAFRRKLGQLVHIQPQVTVRPHVPGAGRLEVPEDERPAVAERSEARRGAVGTRVEEF
ncbi:MAG: hypothetical protein H6706_29480 [Myxococcales bacterium]|nr:hypothetical protein [Myxococcales bacterium]